MINCLIICATIFASIAYILHWVRKMSKDELPHFTIGHLTTTVEGPEFGTNAIDLAAPNTNETEIEPELSDQEQRNQILQDMASTYTAILRGEFDLDEL